MPRGVACCRRRSQSAGRAQESSIWLQHARRPVRRYGPIGYHRSREGDSLCFAECHQYSRDDPDDRGADYGSAREGEACCSSNARVLACTQNTEQNAAGRSSGGILFCVLRFELERFQHGLEVFLHRFVINDRRRVVENVVVDLFVLHRDGGEVKLQTAVRSKGGVLFIPLDSSNSQLRVRRADGAKVVYPLCTLKYRKDVLVDIIGAGEFG